ncbi:alpha-ketoacid dehydrogenase subunit beta [Pelagibacteraceae bacterium]|nr:alpha-ketoacid dehydrogenase subunit beta [Pelagibacteraceae bacterium]
MSDLNQNYFEKITYRDALRLAMHDAMKEDKNIIIMGEDVANYGGAYGATKDLLKLFGKERIIDTPISEPAIVGAAVGAAMSGLRPIAELMYVDFFGMSMDQIANQLAKIRYMFGGQISAPMVLRTQGGTGRSGGAQHSQSLESWIMHTPGLFLSMPAKPNDAYHLLRHALKIDNPTIFIEHKLLYNTTGTLDKNDIVAPFGKANILRKGKDVSIISYSRMINYAEKAAEILEKENISVEVIDLRTLYPLDRETIINSVNKTKRALVLSESYYTSSVPSEITSIIFENCYKILKKPVIRYTAEDTPVPVAPNLEKNYIPTIEKIVEYTKKVCN